MKRCNTTRPLYTTVIVLALAATTLGCEGELAEGTASEGTTSEGTTGGSEGDGSTDGSTYTSTDGSTWTTGGDSVGQTDGTGSDGTDSDGTDSDGTDSDGTDSDGADSPWICDGPTMHIFPVRAQHNIGWDKKSCDPAPCDVSCPDINANSDWGGDHHGIDVFAHDGAELVAVTAGTVVAVGTPSNTSGLRVRLRDACGWEYYYGHLSGATVKKGDWVEAGQPVGYMGKTGTSSVHLHFNVSYDGNYSDDINPFGLLNSTSASACSPPPADAGTHAIFDLGGYLPASAGYTPISSKRLLDTRDGAVVADGEVSTVNVMGPINAQPKDVGAVVFNLTVTQPTERGYLAAFPSDIAYPKTSNVNFAAGQTTAGLVFAKPGADGKVKIHHTGGTSHIIVDMFGWFPADSDLEMVKPQRVFDSRDGDKPKAGSTFDIAVAGEAGIPANAGAVVLNLAVVNPVSKGYATLYEKGKAQPGTSNLNYELPGEAKANLVIVPPSAAGIASLYTHAEAHYVVDVLGWFPEGAGLIPVGPKRLLDTRDDDPLGSEESLDLAVTNVAGVPAQGVSAVFGNLTVTGSTGPGYLQVHPAGSPVPETSTLNFMTGHSVANAVLSEVGAGGKISIRAFVAY